MCAFRTKRGMWFNMKKKFLLIIIIFFLNILVFARVSYAVELNWIFALDSYKQIRDPVGPRPIKPVAGVADFHHGRDISANQGTPVKAVQSGVVEYIGDGNDINNGGCGLQVWVSHNGVYKTMYNHLSVISVQKGQTVTQGQVVGQVGSTGLSTGPHLDFRVYLEGANCKYDKVNGEYLESVGENAGCYIDKQGQVFPEVTIIWGQGGQDNLSGTTSINSSNSGQSQNTENEETKKQVELTYEKKEVEELEQKKSEEHSINEILSEAQSFVSNLDKDGNKLFSLLVGGSLINTSKTINNILLILSIVIAAVIGSFIGIKTMIASTEEKAQVKETLIPYLVGATICFGAFSIWSIMVSFLETI